MMCIERQWVAQSYVDMLDTFVIVRLIGMCGIFVGKCPFPTQNLGKATTSLSANFLQTVSLVSQRRIVHYALLFSARY
jgi:hypothetical protein